MLREARALHEKPNARQKPRGLSSAYCSFRIRKFHNLARFESLEASLPHPAQEDDSCRFILRADSASC